MNVKIEIVAPEGATHYRVGSDGAVIWFKCESSNVLVWHHYCQTNGWMLIKGGRPSWAKRIYKIEPSGNSMTELIVEKFEGDDKLFAAYCAWIDKHHVTPEKLVFLSGYEFDKFVEECGAMMRAGDGADYFQGMKVELREQPKIDSLYKHALNEFKAAGWIGSDGKYCDEMQELMCNQILELLSLFSIHGHSGSSAPYAVDLFKKLAMFEPIVPLTGKDDEWIIVEGGCFQNKRDSSVFKNKRSGQAYWLDGRIFKDPSGACFTSHYSRVPVEFPWTKPESQIVDVEYAESGDVVYPSDIEIFDF